MSLTGRNSAKIIKAALDSGNEIPDKFLNMPELTERSFFFWNAFMELNSCRGEGSIPWLAIDRYAQRYNVDDEMFEDLVDVISALDDEFATYKENERRKK